MSTALRLLILEDNPYDTELEVATLEEAGYTCQWERVETRAEFLACLDAPDYDLVLADYSLPTFDGLTALKLFLERGLDLPFILISGTLGEETAIESLKAGATDYVLKSHLSRLGPVVQRALREKEERRQRKQAEERIQQQTEDLTLMNALNSAVNRGEDLPEIFSLLSQETSRIFSSHAATVYLLSEEHLTVQNLNLPSDMLKQIETLIGIGIPPIRIPLKGDSLYHEALQAGKPCIVSDPGAIQRLMAEFVETVQLPGPLRQAIRSLIPQIYRIINIESMIIAPLISEGEPLGLLDISRREPFTEMDLHRVAAISEPVTAIIKRKRLEQELEARRLYLESVLACAPDAIVTLDAQRNILEWSPGAEKLYGYTVEEVVGRNLDELVTASDTRTFEEAAGFTRQVLRGEDLLPTETVRYRKDGSAVDVIAAGSPIWVENKVIGVVAAYTDISERKRAEEALRKSEEKYRNLVETSQDSVVIIDLKGNVQFANKATEKLTGYTLEEGIGISVREITLPKYWPQSLAMLMKAKSGKPIPYFESVIRRKDGALVPVESGGQAIVEEGQVVGIQIITRDISERRRAEELLRTLNEAALAMRQALTPEEIFTAVGEELKQLGFSCAVFLTDESQSRLLPRYLSYETGAVKAAEKLAGLKAKDFAVPVETAGVLGEAIYERKTVFVENAEDAIRQMLPEPLKRFVGQMIKILKVKKAINAPLIAEDKVIGLLTVQSDDLTEDDIPAITAFAHQMAAAWRKAQLLQDLQSSLEELKRTQAQLLQLQKMEAIGQLAGGIAHDFNNLLTPISGFAELLLWKAAEGSEQQEYLRQIKVAAERAAALTRQLRLFTRQAAGERHPIQPNDVVEETHDLLKRSIAKEIAVELNLASDLRTVEADPSQIGQVLMNLCLNACDAMPKGGTLTLETCNVALDEEYARQVLTAQPGHYVRLSVSDTGAGMGPEVRARLFEPFFTTKEVGKGTGLGLAVAYGIVKGHGGFIQVYSEVGRGSTFQVYLPAIESVVEEKKAEELELPTGTETILLVDDEEMVRALGRRVLEHCSYTVLVAEDGVQALEVYRARRGEIALVVLDVMMPQMGGLECLRRLREMEPQVKVLISTGYTAKSLAQELVAEGALGVVEKPFLLRDFAVAVRRALDES